MEITSKQRAKLRGMAQNIETIAQFGKNELSPEQIVMVEQMLTKRELIKCSVLENSPYTARELANMLAEETGAIAVDAIGRKFVLYRRNEKEPVISLD
ncbi:MAG: YhbY family RNA-binding protein [Oscillospiraceae bacterium]|nr:YhbY family RNA-binding protein [Oscillospiraceae bacterium]MBQ4538159.1 YhbY family RNA-binding protein [Oscillospiraceae bacterium]